MLIWNDLMTTYLNGISCRLYSVSHLPYPAKCQDFHEIDRDKLKVVECYPGVQSLTVRRCFVVAPVYTLAVDGTNVQTVV